MAPKKKGENRRRGQDGVSPGYWQVAEYLIRKGAIQPRKNAQNAKKECVYAPTPWMSRSYFLPTFSAIKLLFSGLLRLTCSGLQHRTADFPLNLPTLLSNERRCVELSLLGTDPFAD